MSGMRQINLNGLVIEVDEDTASILEGDPIFRGNYEKAVRQQLNLTDLAQQTCNPTLPIEDKTVHKVEPEAQEQQLVWCSKKPTPRDIEATSFFLELRKKHAPEFNDKKNTKNVLWNLIVKEMNSNNFFVGLGMEATERCRKKFANLQATFMKYTDEKRKTGQGKLEKPPFFDELDEILGSKDKVTPPIIIDSISNENAKPHDILKPELKPLPGPSNVGINKYENIKPSSKPEKSQLIKELIDIQKKDSEERKSDVARMFSFLETTAAQRHDLIMALLRKKETKKRKRKDSSSDTD